jgi:hypothetical protein
MKRTVLMRLAARVGLFLVVLLPFLLATGASGQGIPYRDHTTRSATGGS